jgi:hypothetical protein
MPKWTVFFLSGVFITTMYFFEVLVDGIKVIDLDMVFILVLFYNSISFLYGTCICLQCSAKSTRVE